jgi:hypothetical protein
VTCFCRVCRGEASLRLHLPGGVGETVAAAAQGNNFPGSLPRPFGVFLWCQWRDQGRRGSGGSPVQVSRAGGASSLSGDVAVGPLSWVRCSFWAMWTVAGWICLDFPSAVLSVIGEVGSRSWMGWGVAPVDGRLPLASSRLPRRVSTLTPPKASGRWAFSSSG